MKAPDPSDPSDPQQPPAAPALAGLLEQLRPYPRYKATGLPWLPQVPEHWEVRRGKTIFRCIDERSKTGREELLTVTSSRGVVPRRTAVVTMFKAVSYVGYKLCWPGDLVINSLWAWGSGLGVSLHHGIVSSAYGVYRIRPGAPAVPRFIHELVRSSPFHWELQVRSKGIWLSRLQLTDDAFLDAPLPLPPPAEQEAVVRFLDWAGGRIERVVRARRRLIGLLQELRQALLQRAVTGQVDVRTGRPYPRYKPSGLPWLGPIPEHWEVSRVKNEFQCLNSKRIPLSGPERGRMKLRLYDYYGASGVIDKVDGYLFDDELLLIAEDGANLVLRNLPLAIIARGKFWVNNHAHVLKPKRGNLVFLAGVMERLNYLPWISGAAQPKLTQDRLMSIAIAVAPSAEQDAIVQHLADQTASIDSALALLERELALLRELRTRLVADVVTGQLDVRAVAAGLPAEAPPEEEPAQEEPSEESDWSDEDEPATLPP